MEIIKAKITKDSTLEATYRDDTGTISIAGKNLVTNDLIDAFAKLIPHLAFLTEQKEASGEKLDTLPDISKILEVTGYTRGGQDESAGVTLTGKRILQSGKVLNLNSPFTQLQNENEQYEYQFELEQALETCEYEVHEYLFNQKWKVVQQELPFEEEQVTTDVIPADVIPEADITDKDKAEFAKEIKITASRRNSRKRQAV